MNYLSIFIIMLVIYPKNVFSNSFNSTTLKKLDSNISSIVNSTYTNPRVSNFINQLNINTKLKRSMLLFSKKHKLSKFPLIQKNKFTIEFKSTNNKFRIRFPVSANKLIQINGQRVKIYKNSTPESLYTKLKTTKKNFSYFNIILPSALASDSSDEEGHGFATILSMAIEFKNFITLNRDCSYSTKNLLKYLNLGSRSAKIKKVTTCGENMKANFITNRKNISITWDRYSNILTETKNGLKTVYTIKLGKTVTNAKEFETLRGRNILTNGKSQPILDTKLQEIRDYLVTLTAIENRENNLGVNCSNCNLESINNVFTNYKTPKPPTELKSNHSLR